MKKIISVILALAMVMSMFGITAFAQDATTNVSSGVLTWLAPSAIGGTTIQTPPTEVFAKNATGASFTEDDTTVQTHNYYAKGSFFGGDEVTAVYMGSQNDTDNKTVYAVTNTSTITEQEFDADDRLHFSAYVALVSGKIGNVNVMMGSGGIPISGDAMGGYLNNHKNEWVKLDILYQPLMKYTYTRTDAAGVAEEGLVYERLGFIKGASGSVEDATVLSSMEGYDAEKYTYAITKVEYGKMTSYVNGRLVKNDEVLSQDKPAENTFKYGFDNLPTRLAFNVTSKMAEEKVSLYTAKGKVYKVDNFDVATFAVDAYPEVSTTKDYFVNGNKLIISDTTAITVADITATEGCVVSAYKAADTAYAAPVDTVLEAGDKVVVKAADGISMAYYTVAVDEINYVYGPITGGNELAGIQNATLSETTEPLAGKPAPAVKIQRPDDIDTTAGKQTYFEARYGKFPSIDTPRYIVLEMNYMPTDAAASFVIGGQQSATITADLNGLLRVNQWNKIVMIWTNGSTDDNPYPGNTKYTDKKDAVAANPHSYVLYVNGIAADVGKPGSKAFGMTWADGGRKEDFLRILTTSVQTTAGNTAYVDDLKFYDVNMIDEAALTALPQLPAIPGASVNGVAIIPETAVAVSDVLAIEGATVFADESCATAVTEGNLAVGNVVAYTDGTDVSYYTVSAADDLVRYELKDYDESVKVNNGTSAQTTGPDGEGDTAYTFYTTNLSEKNGYIAASAIYDRAYFSQRPYSVFEADVKFESEGSYFFFGSNGHAHVSPSVNESSPFVKSGQWNKFVTVVEYETGLSRTYVNGVLVKAPEKSTLAKEGTNTAIRIIAYGPDGVTEDQPLASVDNIKVYATMNPPVFDDILTASAYDANSGVTFSVSDAAKAMDSHAIVVAAYDADGKLAGNITIGKDSVTVAPAEGAVKYVGFVWSSASNLIPLSQKVVVDAK